MIWMYNKEDINIIDINEINKHELSKNCKCKPTITEHNDKTFIIHTCEHKLDEQTKHLLNKC